MSILTPRATIKEILEELSPQITADALEAFRIWVRQIASEHPDVDLTHMPPWQSLEHSFAATLCRGKYIAKYNAALLELIRVLHSYGVLENKLRIAENGTVMLYCTDYHLVLSATRLYLKLVARENDRPRLEALSLYPLTSGDKTLLIQFIGPSSLYRGLEAKDVDLSTVNFKDLYHGQHFNKELPSNGTYAGKTKRTR